MNDNQKRDIKNLIKFYERRGWDWSSAVEFLIRKYNNSLYPLVIRTHIGADKPSGRPRRGKII